MQKAAKVVIVFGSIIAVLCAILAFFLPLPPGMRTISNYDMFLYALIGAVIPIGVTIYIASRYSPVIDLECQHCHHTETVAVELRKAE
jgi:hypothetical protein